MRLGKSLGYEPNGTGMRHFAQNAAKALRYPGAFALAILKQFRANQGLLLAGAVAYC